MSDISRPLDTSDIPQAIPVAGRRRPLQLVWIIPILAAVIGGYLAVKNYLEHGPTITIAFKTAEGMEAGKTKLKYKDVDIGIVTLIVLSDDRKGVVATAELTKQAADLLADDTRFWVVRPRIAGGQVSGLSTLLSGSYVAIDPGTSKQTRRDFVGLEVAPLVTGDDPGRQFVLHADDLGSLQIGSPVYFRRLEVGQVVASDLDKNGKGVTFRIFVHAPYDQYVTTNTRFWNASGIDVSLDASGFRVQTESLISILLGGIAFQARPDADVARPAEPNATFRLSATRTEALQLPDTVAENYVLEFTQSIRGLSIGAPVDFRGVIIGEVTSINLEYDAAKVAFITPVGIRIYPDRLRTRFNGKVPLTPIKVDPAERMRLFVDHGMRGQLRTGNLLTGQLYVVLDFFPDARKVKVDMSKSPLVLPTIPSDFQELQTSIASIVKKIDQIPFDQIAAELRKAVATLDQTLQDTDVLVKGLHTDVAPELKTALVAAHATLANAQHVLSADAPLQTDLRTMLQEVTRTAASLRVLTDYLERNPEALIRGKREEDTK